MSAKPGFHNPWRESLENCITGDNYLKAQEYADLIEELDDLYRYRCGTHDSLNVAYANGRDDQREEDAELVSELLEALKRCRFDSLNMSLADLEFCRAAFAKATEGATRAGEQT